MQDETSQKVLRVSSMIDVSQDYIFSIINNDTNVSVVSTKTESISISPDGNDLDLNFSCGANAKGEYQIVLNFEGDSNVTYPLNLVCVSSQTKLTFNPTSKDVTLASGETSTQTFSLCNTASTDLFISKTDIF
jgi:hypothetical protein